MFVPKRDVYDTVVSKDTQGVKNGHLLSTSKRTGRHENASVLAGESTGCPKTTGRVPEGLPLGGVVIISSGNTEEEGVVGGEDVRSDDWVVRFGGSMHLP